jgi:hypothetical protein
VNRLFRLTIWLVFGLCVRVAPADAPPLPRVLILGDSISLGYTDGVRRKLKDVAEVRRPAENCQHSGYALTKIRSWIGDEKWDVIHFNWGIWDTHMVGESGNLIRDEAAYPGPMHIRHTPDQYRRNLARILGELQKTGAKLVWANTTPILKREGRRFEDIPALNREAVELMREHNIAINDLYELTLPHAKLWQNADQVHFNAQGNEQLAERVALAIRNVLPAQKAVVDPMRSGAEESHDFKNAYTQLLSLFAEDTPGRGVDRGKPGVQADQPMTYGLIISCEGLRYRATPTEDGRRRIRQATLWLLENSRLAPEGKMGWGLPFEWNSHPANTSYTITTAVVIEGLLDVLTLSDFWSTAEQERILTALRDVQLRWCRELWVDTPTGGYFRYDTDDTGEGWFCVNAPAMFLGAMSRFLRNHSEFLTAAEQLLMTQRRDALAGAIVASVRLRDHVPYWEYIVSPNKLQSVRPNDLVHQAYILWGLEQYRDTHGPVPIPWSRQQSLDSLNRFWKDGSLRFFAQDELSIRPANREAPSNLWGIGMYLAILGKWGAPGEAARCFSSLLKTHGPFPTLRVLPASVSEDARFYPRDGAHVLFGLAHTAFPEGASAKGVGGFDKKLPE